MSTNLVSIEIKKLPQLNTVDAGDFIVIDTPDGTGIIDFADITIPLEQTDFKPTIDTLVSDVTELSSAYTSLSSSLYTDILEAYNDSTAMFKYVAPLTANNIFSGVGVDIPFNYIEVNGISTQQVAQNTVANVCGDTTLSTQTSSFVFPQGTYKVFIDATFSAVSANTWTNLYLYQKTPPIQVLNHGSVFMSKTANETGHLFVRGYFYLCRASEISLRANTTGDFRLGVPTSSLVASATASSLSASLLQNLQLSACHVSMYIEKVSDGQSPTINRLSMNL